ncbi:MAG: hypothetical protein ACWGOV_12465 [Acidiferrobacterales bacterium]
MKLLPILLIFVPLSGYAEEECVFDETAYIKFISSYNKENKNSKIKPDGKTLVVKRNNEEVIVKGGGCVHLGEEIDLRTKQEFTEEQFLRETLDLATEFGDWLINTKKLKDSIDNGKYQKIDGIYFIEVDAMTVFSASYDNQGNISIDFYIN